jgi:hypothetical protein
MKRRQAEVHRWGKEATAGDGDGFEEGARMCAAVPDKAVCEHNRLPLGGQTGVALRLWAAVAVFDFAKNRKVCLVCSHPRNFPPLCSCVFTYLHFTYSHC